MTVAVLTAGEDASVANETSVPGAQLNLRPSHLDSAARVRAAVVVLGDDAWAMIPLLSQAGPGAEAEGDGDLDPWGDQGRGLLLRPTKEAAPAGALSREETLEDLPVW